jgi:hypothetical protein
MANRNLEREIELLREGARLRAEMGNSLEGYLTGLKTMTTLQKELVRQDEIIAKLEKEAETASGEALTNLQKKIGLLQKERVSIETNIKRYQEANKETNKGLLLSAKGLGMVAKGIVNIPNTVNKTLDKISSYGLFKMDKAIKQSSLNMGLMTNQSKMLRFDITDAANSTLEIGDGIEELAKYQSDYSDELGRSIMLGRKGLEAISEMAKGTGLGAEGAAKMAADFEMQGISAERTRDLIEESVNTSGRLGLNASKIIKNMQQNFKLLNKYSFKGGVKGLIKMAETTTKLGIEMNSIGGMADKLFEIEGAVDMSAQLQVMGGAWAQMADPFHLMYMARNDMEGLTREIGEAAKSSVVFNKESGEFQVSALEMHRLRKIAEQTGVAYEDLVTAGKNAAKYTKIRSQLSFNISDPNIKEFIENTAMFNKEGKAEIEFMVNGKPVKKLVSQITQMDLASLELQSKEEKTLKELAKEARTFDEAFNNTVNLFKKSLLPFIDAINTKLLPSLDGFTMEMKQGGWLDKIGKFTKEMGNLVSGIAGFMLDNPVTSLITFLGTWSVMQAATWYAHGVQLGLGFNTVTQGKGGVMELAKGFGKIAGPLIGTAVGTGIGMWLGSKASSAWGNDDTMTGDVAGIGGGLLGGIAGGALAGASAGVWGGPWGMALGALIGAGIGATGGKFFGDMAASDAVFTSPIGDGIIGNSGPKLGSNYDKSRGIIQNGKITPIDNKDDLLAMKKGGTIDKFASKTESKPGIIKHEFSDLNINGSLVISIPGNQSMGVDLLKDPMFIRDISKMIKVEMQRSVNQVQKG